MARIAVVDDEADLRFDLVEYLAGCGHQVVGCADGSAFAEEMAKEPFDIVVLDVNLPGENGFTIAGRLREHSEVGIIMLTARNLTIDRVVGLEKGADVYCVKPVDLRELEAQVRSLARRLKTASPPRPAAVPSTPAAAASWKFDDFAWILIAPDGASLKLTGNERTFIALLVAQPGQPVPRNDIFVALGKRHWDPEDRSIDSLVRRLRAKAQSTFGRPLPIEAVHGVGYAFTAPVANG